jgi:uncharacterized membrane protein YozB (DUF420 family)
MLVVTVAATLLCIILAASTPVTAHAPEDITLIYNEQREILTIAVKHDVKDPATHYVEMLEIYLNDALIIERTFDEQPRDNFNERFNLPAKEGDSIRARALWNIGSTSEDYLEQDMLVGPGVTAEGDRAGTIDLVIIFHAAIQVIAFGLAIANIPGGWSFYRAWKTKTKPTGRRRRHIRMGTVAGYMWGAGALGGLWIVYMTSGDYVGSPHGWLAVGVFISAIFAGYAASPRFRKAGYGMRLHAHIPLALLTIVLGLVTIVTGLLTAGII